MKRLSEDGADTVAIQRKIEEKAGEKTALEHSFEKCEAVLTSAEKGFESDRLELASAQRSAKLFEEMETSSAKLSAAEQKLSGLKFDEGKYELARKESEAMRVEQARSETLLRSEEKQLALLLQMLEMEGNALQGLQQKQELAKKYAQAAQSMAIYKNSLSAVQSELRTLLVDEINQALSEVWPSIYPYGDYAGVRLEADEKDYRLLMQKADWAEVDAIASGGERACLCLALRIAFATVLTPDLSWLILDEPTHNLDSDAVLMLSEAINRKIPSIVEQTFVITHDTALGEAGEGAVFRLERDKSKNESTKIEKLG